MFEGAALSEFCMCELTFVKFNLCEHNYSPPCILCSHLPGIKCK